MALLHPPFRRHMEQRDRRVNRRSVMLGAALVTASLMIVLIFVSGLFQL